METVTIETVINKMFVDQKLFIGRFIPNEYLFMFHSSKPEFLKNKFYFLKTFLENDKNSIKQKMDILTIFENYQKFVFGMNKLKQIVKWKKSKIYNTEDLHMNPIEPNQKNTMTILQNNTRYVFHIRELITCLKTYLTNASNFFVEPIYCKNPYTNIPFDKSTLYNIYFAINNSTYMMPPIFQQFFLYDFNISKFAIDNEEMLSLASFKSYVNNNVRSQVKKYVEMMFTRYNTGLIIDPIYSDVQLFSYMRPYLELYIKSLYAPRHSQRHSSSRELYIKLRRFGELNPLFGRKKVKIERDGNNPFLKKRKLTVVFDDVHIYENAEHFNNESDRFIQSHTCKYEFNNRDIPFTTVDRFFRNRFRYTPSHRSPRNDTATPPHEDDSHVDDSEAEDSEAEDSDDDMVISDNQDSDSEIDEEQQEQPHDSYPED